MGVCRRYLEIPEIGFALHRGTLGAVYTTVEGVMVQARDNLLQVCSFYLGDSGEGDQKSKMQEFFHQIDQCIGGKMDFTMVGTVHGS